MSVQQIAIIYGGRSTEHEISIRSARNIAKAIDRTRYSISLIAISKDGTWYSKSMDELKKEDIVIASANRLSLIPEAKEVFW
jgi:D-alanine-D-alanine ligase